MMLLSSSVSAPSRISSTALPVAFGGVAHGAGKARIKIADRHHARGGDFVLQVVRELGEFIDVGIDAAHEAFELGQDFVDVRGNFGQRARQDVEIVVAIHFQLAEFVDGRSE